MTWRLGIDLGPASIGWVALRLDTEGVVINIIDGGVRLFSDGRNDKDNEPFNLRRRQQRGMRRNKDRRQQRVQNIEKALRYYAFNMSIYVCYAFFVLSFFDIKKIDV